ncbi:MAG: hypothetical protein QOJ30_4441, partial [Pseudonocardiales bacterium]|nr:hypothetical protein [Pseudonocardiales bacterium]
PCTTPDGTRLLILLVALRRALLHQHEVKSSRSLVEAQEVPSDDAPPVLVAVCLEHAEGG